MDQHTKPILIAKVGLDGHDRGAKLVARALRDAGEGVIYSGLRRTVEEVVRTVREEGVEFLGLSFLAGDHMTLVPKVMRALTEAGLGQVKLVVGGIIPEKDASQLLQMGVEQVFFPGTPLPGIVAYFQEQAAAHPTREAEPPIPVPR